MLSNSIVVVHVVESLGEHLLPVGNFEDPGDVKFIVISAMGTLKVRVLFRMFHVVLDELTTETGKQFSELNDLVPGFPSEFFPMIHGENNLVRDAMAS